MVKEDFTSTRLEAISDAVIAVAITIMLLELHPPHEPTLPALLGLWPQFESYVISFGFIATYWVNHHYLFHHLKRVDEKVLWSNMLLLFLLSLIPFATAYAGDSREASFPTAVYAAVMLANALAYALLSAVILAQYRGEPRPRAFGRVPQAISAAAVTVYALAIPAAFFHPTLSLAMIFAMTLTYVTPLVRPD